MIELEAQDFYRSYLTAGEAVLWQGRPGKGHLITAQDVFLIPFSLLWCGFAVFWEFGVIAAGAPLIMKLWGIPFVCVGLYMVFGRFFWTAWQRKRTAYVITNRKIIRNRGNRIDMLQSGSLPDIHVSVNRDGSGTIRFGYARGYRGMRLSPEQNPGQFSLENIPDVVRVQQLLRYMEH